MLVWKHRVDGMLPGFFNLVKRNPHQSIYAFICLHMLFGLDTSLAFCNLYKIDCFYLYFFPEIFATFCCMIYIIFIFYVSKLRLCTHAGSSIILVACFVYSNFTHFSIQYFYGDLPQLHVLTFLSCIRRCWYSLLTFLVIFFLLGRRRFS